MNCHSAAEGRKLPFCLQVRQLLLLAVLVVSQGLFAQKAEVGFCHFFLSETSLEVPSSTRLMGYLIELLKVKVVSVESLKKLQVSLADNSTEFLNPVLNKTSSDHKIHAEQIGLYLTGADLDKKEFLQNLSQFLKDQDQVRESKEQSREATQDKYKQMKFNKVVMPNSTILMMDTHVTQKMWFDLMGAHPGHIGTDKEILDLPVTYITWWSAIQYANSLSKKENLEPVYGFDHIQFDPSTWLAGGGLHSGILNAPNEPVINDTDGYRLPTLEEQKWIRSKITNVVHQEWSKETTTTIQPVAELEPYNIDGNRFYDLQGNVYEWSQDQDMSPGEGRKGIYRFTMGRSVIDDKNQSVIIPNQNQDFSNAYIGLRLVRTVKPKAKP